MQGKMFTERFDILLSFVKVLECGSAQAELCSVALLPRAQVWLMCAFIEARQDDIPGEAAPVETVYVVIAGELNEMLSSAWEERDCHLKSRGHICLLLSDIYVFWGLLFTGNYSNE